MIELWHNTETDEYILKEDGVTEKLSEMAGRFLRSCARENEALREENIQLTAFIRNLGAVYYYDRSSRP